MALLLIHQGPEYGAMMVGGMKALHAADTGWAQWDYATAHALGPQRFETVACMAYGANPRLFGDYREQGLVSAERAPRCAAAYQRVYNGLGQRFSRHMNH